MIYWMLSLLELITYILFCVFVMHVKLSVYCKRQVLIIIFFMIVLIPISFQNKSVRLFLSTTLQFFVFLYLLNEEKLNKIKLFFTAWFYTGFLDICFHLILNIVIKVNRNNLTEIISFLFLNILWIIVFPKMKSLKYVDELNYFPTILYLNLIISCLSSSLIMVSLLLYKDQYSIYIKLLLISISVSSLFLSIYTIIRFIQSNKLKYYYQNKSILLEHNLQIQSEYYDNIYKQYENVRGLKHDLDAHLYSISTLIFENKNKEALEYIEHIQNDVLHYNKSYQCMDPYISAIVFNLEDIISNNEIDFEFLYLLPCEMVMSPYEKSSLYYNLLLNSIEACKKVDDKRRIRFITDYSNNCVLISVTNSIPKEFTLDNFNNRITTKKDKKFHGLGMKNVEKIIHKYNGIINGEVIDNQIRITISLYNAI